MKLETALENLEFYAYHGLYPEEKTKGGKFTVDVWLEQEMDETKNLSNINELVDYEKVYGLIKTQMEQTRDLIEEVAKAISDVLATNCTNAVLIKVKITKHNPAGKFGVGNASVTLSKQIYKRKI